ncbi:MAG: hypothetical protein EA402_10150 [Planctomycetota bacterium]|nr:MAG: hypothetical protein EA402_10150 [Planctomycetota bacterium]
MSGNEESQHPQIDQFTGAELRDHAFDGIQEYDNNLPLWWQAILYLSIIWAIGYVAWFHFGPGKLGEERLLVQLEEVAEQRRQALLEMGEISEEMLRAFLSDQSAIARGRELYHGAGQCVSCHGADGLGVSAPNLRDDYWKYGSNMMDIFTTLQEGRANGAMPRFNAPVSDIISLTAFLVHWNRTEKARGGVRIEGSVLDPIDY